MFNICHKGAVVTYRHFLIQMSPSLEHENELAYGFISCNIPEIGMEKGV